MGSNIDVARLKPQAWIEKNPGEIAALVQLSIYELFIFTLLINEVFHKSILAPV